jgi:hypothetical protein
VGRMSFGDLNLTCKAAIRLLCDYLEGRLSRRVSRELRRHYNHCRDCRLVVDAAVATLGTYFSGESVSVAEAKPKVA